MLTQEQLEVYDLTFKELKSLADDYGYRLEFVESKFDDDGIEKVRIVNIVTSDGIGLSFYFDLEDLVGFFFLFNEKLKKLNDYELFIRKYLPDVKFIRKYRGLEWRKHIPSYFQQIRKSIEHPNVKTILEGKKWVEVPFVWEDYVDTETAEKIHQDMVNLIDEEQVKRDAEVPQGGKLAKIINFDIIRKIKNILK